ncbi:MAG: hypothetical protein A2026_20100 [Deltaproteobacteria bacterium RBG_19FT_COMBO_46_12]|nr:MAG: hypothetical protein A2026_20100 [Deltaproteobacteria bacterium RBG_19FT_COMBO_46_12]
MAGIHERYLKNPVAKDLEDRMVFIGGPRQVGKTTFALTFLSEATEIFPSPCFRCLTPRVLIVRTFSELSKNGIDNSMALKYY